MNNSQTRAVKKKRTRDSINAKIDAIFGDDPVLTCYFCRDILKNPKDQPTYQGKLFHLGCLRSYAALQAKYGEVKP